MKDIMGREGLVPSLLVFGVLPSLLILNKPPPTEKERMEAMNLFLAEMTTISVEIRIKKALRSKRPPATQYQFKPENSVRVYKENDKKGMDLLQLYEPRAKI